MTFAADHDDSATAKNASPGPIASPDPTAGPSPTADPAASDSPAPEAGSTGEAARDLAEVPAVEVISTVAINLMSAAAVKLGLAEDLVDAAPDEHTDLDEARKLVTALAGLVTAAAPEIGSHHAAPLRDGLKSLQLAFREASVVPDPPGQGPGEKLTGPVYSSPRQGR